MHKRALRLLLPSLLLAATLTACGDKAVNAPAAGSAPQSKSFDLTKKATDAADEEETKRYRLTIEGVRKFHAINLAMEKLDPEKSGQASGISEDSAAAAEKESDGGSNSPSHDQLETSINSNKQARALIAAQGMGTREYVVMTSALFVVAAAQTAIDLGAKPDAVAKEFGAENLQFYKEHRKEFDAMQKTSKSK